MYEDSNRNKINTIGAYLKLNYDMNDEKGSKTDDHRKVKYWRKIEILPI